MVALDSKFIGTPLPLGELVFAEGALQFDTLQ